MRENLNLKPFLISATALAEFIQCPRKFFYAQILELEVPERPVAALIGLLLHEAMAHFLAPHKETKAPEAQIVGDWVHEFCLTHDEFKNLPEGMRVTIERFTARSLNEFFASETVWEGEVIGVEKSFELSLPTGFAIRGRIDRVDMTAEGMEVIDYKSSWSFASAKLKSEFLKAEEWIQLPIYVKAAEIHLEQKVAKISIIFFGLKSKDKPRRTTVRIMEGSRPASQTRGARDLVYGDEFGETWQRISHIVESIFQEGQSFDRGENPPCEDSFLGCPFVRICPVSKLSDEEQEENSL
jgi:ATP-dependent helicase/DNAse subunit B